MLAYDYPILGLFWTMLMFFLWIAWLMLLFRVFADIFRSDMSGWSKAAWSIFVIIVPLLGVLIYLIANGDQMTARNVESMRQSQAQMDAYIRSAAGTGGTADEIARLSELHSNGVLTDEEFAQQKSKLLAG